MKKITLFFLLVFSQIFFAQSDCVTAFAVCGNTSISYTPSGHGNVAEDLGGCLIGDEHYAVWYSFTIATSGTLAFTINPNDPTTDYDFAVYGPNKTCANFGAPIRCNFSGADGPTGLSLSVIHPAVSGTWSGYINAVAGETYYLVVDNYDHNTTGFQLQWTGTATLSSPYNATIQPNAFINPGPAHDGNIPVCTLPTSFNFATLSAGILNNNPNFVITYHLNANDAVTGANPITTYTVNAASTYYYSIHYQDPANANNPINNCRQTGTIKFISGAITAAPKTISACEVNQSNTAVFDLTSAAVFSSSTIPFVVKYYPTAADAAAGTNEILNPAAYSSSPKIVYAKVTRTDLGCTSTAAITLTLGPKTQLTTYNSTQSACVYDFDGGGTALLSSYNSVFTTDPAVFIAYYATQANAYAQTNELTTQQVFSGNKTFYLRVKKAGLCDNFATLTLTPKTSKTASATTCDDDLDGNLSVVLSDFNTNISSDPAASFFYFGTKADAVANSNAIMTPTVVSGTKVFYVRVKSAGNCDDLYTFTLTVNKPSASAVLKDKTICVEQTTTLDAGTGFTNYLWSTGATTQSIANVGLGTYTVKLTSPNGCAYTQTVNVLGYPLATITGIEISNNTATISATGGSEPYTYSVDGLTWQNSNVFTNLPRGQNTFYVKDAHNCVPQSVEVTVPNLINVITPNGDNVNDVVDYSALAYKQNVIFTVYDRYGNRIFVGDSKNNYTWDGRGSGKKVLTGTYWYTITWNEPDQTKAPVKYSGWILVKNRD